MRLRFIVYIARPPPVVHKIVLDNSKRLLYSHHVKQSPVSSYQLLAGQIQQAE
jgi:hypothetical protein